MYQWVWPDPSPPDWDDVLKSASLFLWRPLVDFPQNRFRSGLDEISWEYKAAVLRKHGNHNEQRKFKSVLGIWQRSESHKLYQNQYLDWNDPIKCSVYLFFEHPCTTIGSQYVNTRNDIVQVCLVYFANGH